MPVVYRRFHVDTSVEHWDTFLLPPRIFVPQRRSSSEKLSTVDGRDGRENRRNWKVNVNPSVSIVGRRESNKGQSLRTVV